VLVEGWGAMPKPAEKTRSRSCAATGRLTPIQNRRKYLANNPFLVALYGSGARSGGPVEQTWFERLATYGTCSAGANNR
jgi:hypothetical protein